MAELNTCKLKFEFEFGSIQDRRMDLEIVNDNSTLPIIPGADGRAKIQINIKLPTKVILRFGGKNANTDTIIDSQGNIINDMFVKIVKIDFDGFELGQVFLHQKIQLHTYDDQIITTSYIGHNGQITFDFTESDVFRQYLLCNQ
jgi:hypothetical protein